MSLEPLATAESAAFGREPAVAPTPVGQPQSAAAAAVEALRLHGVSHVFGLPGTTILHLLDALGQQSEMRYISTRHEQVAGFMADGFARGCGRLAACLASRGPGAANLAIALDNALSESIPLLALVGQVDDEVVHRRAFEEMDLVKFFEPITKWSLEVHDASRVPDLVQRGADVALSGRPGPVMVSLPLDVQTRRLSTPRQRPPTRVLAPVPAQVEIDAAAKLLARAKRPLIVVGGGAERSNARDEVARLAETLGAPVVASWQRKAAFPSSHPAFIGVLGFGAFAVTERAVREADVILSLGCRFSQFTSDRWTLLDEQTQVIQVDVDPAELGRSYAADHALWGDAAASARSLLDALGCGTEGPAGRLDYRRRLRAAYEREAQLPPGLPGRAVASADVLRGLLHAQLSYDPIIVQDAPTFGVWMQRYLPIERPFTYFGNAGGAMGWGLPAALGIQLARPGERVLAVMGDGGFWMIAQDLETAVREGIPVVTLVVNNFAYGNTRDRQRADHGGRFVGVFYQNPDFAAFARLLGAHGERVERADDLAPAIDRAMASGLPAVIDVIQDQHEGLPPGVRPPPVSTGREES